MKTPVRNFDFKKLIIPGLASLFLAACSTAPNKPDGADAARNKLSLLQADPQLSSRAPLAIKDAELAVSAAEKPQSDKELGRHLVVIADRKVDIARSQAQGRLLEDQRKTLGEQRETARLDARTREADRARSDAAVARGDAKAARNDANAARSDAVNARNDADIAKINADIARSDTDTARSETDAARLSAAVATQQAADLQKQLTELNAKTTDRGLVVTLGDILFDTGKSQLKTGATSNLGRLAAFLNKYPDRTALIEGHTDDIGADNANQDLSQRRADAVKSYLVGQGVGNRRLSATGMGEGSPVAGNDSAGGRQQNRRVEVIIANTINASS